MFGLEKLVKGMDDVWARVEEMERRVSKLEEGKKVYYCEMCRYAFKPTPLPFNAAGWYWRLNYSTDPYPIYETTTHCPACYPKALAEAANKAAAKKLGEWAQAHPDAASKCKAKWDAAQGKEKG